MLADLIVLSVGIRVIVGAVQHSHHRRVLQPAADEDEHQHDRDEGV
jgi:hypothetical protein